MNKSGISPVISHSLRKTCSTHSNENTSSYQSHSPFHYICFCLYCTFLRFSKISVTVFPTIGTQIFGIPVPISKFLTFIVFIVCFPPWITVLYLLYLILKNPAKSSLVFIFSASFNCLIRRGISKKEASRSTRSDSPRKAYKSQVEYQKHHNKLPAHALPYFIKVLYSVTFRPPMPRKKSAESHSLSPEEYTSRKPDADKTFQRHHLCIF